jgi:hypothetical protein
VIHRRSRWSRGLVATLIVLLSSPAARAEGRVKPDTRMTEVKRACVAGEVDKGVALLAELYAKTNDPTAIYNQGRCYQQNARPEQAVSKFEEYLRKAKDITPEERVDVERFIAELNEDIERAKPPAPAPAPAPVVVSPQPVDEARPGSRLRKAGVVLGALGVAAVGAGVVFGVMMKSKEDEIDRQTRAPGYVDAPEVKGPFADGKRYETLQFVGYGVGAVALIAGTACYVLGARREARAQLTVAPLATASLGGLSLAGTF